MVSSLITAAVPGALGLLMEGVGEALIEGLFGCLGAAVVWLVTFGRLRLDPWSRDQPGTAMMVGLVLVLAVCGVCLAL